MPHLLAVTLNMNWKRTGEVGGKEKALSKQALLNRIKEVKGEILVLNQSSKSKLPLSNVDSQNQNVAIASIWAVDRLNLDDIRELDTFTRGS